MLKPKTDCEKEKKPTDRKLWMKKPNYSVSQKWTNQKDQNLKYLLIWIWAEDSAPSVDHVLQIQKAFLDSSKDQKRKIHSGLWFSQRSGTIVEGRLETRKHVKCGMGAFMWACDTRVANFVATVANQKEEWITTSKKALKTKQNKTKQIKTRTTTIFGLYKSVKVKPNSLVKFFYVCCEWVSL